MIPQFFEQTELNKKHNTPICGLTLLRDALISIEVSSAHDPSWMADILRGPRKPPQAHGFSTMAHSQSQTIERCTIYTQSSNKHSF